MDRLLRRTLLIAFAAILLTGGLLYGYFTHLTDQRLALNQTQLKSAYRGINLGYQEFADVVSQWILDDPENLSLLRQIEGGDANARGLLYRRLYPLYETLRAKQVRQLQFISPDGHSLLRMHAPELSGDDLSGIRPLIQRVVQSKAPATRFEIGRLMSGFRYMYPVMAKGKVIAVMEVGLSFTAIRRLLARDLGKDAIVRFMIRREDLLKALDMEGDGASTLFQSSYASTNLSPDYVTENLDNPLFGEQKETQPASVSPLERQLGKTDAVRAAIQHGEPFAHEACLAGGACYLANGLPVRGSDDRVVAYVLACVPDSGYRNQWLAMLAAFAIASLLIGLLASLVLRQRRTRRRLLALSEHVDQGIYVTDHAGRITYANPSASHILGYKRHELLGRNAHRLFHASAKGQPDDHSLCLIDAATREGHVYRSEDVVFRARDGSLIPVEVVASPIIDAGEITAEVTLFSDIRERRAHEQRLREADAALRAAAEGITITDSQGLIKAVNPAFTRLTGYSEAEVLGKNPRILSSGRQPREFYAQMWRELLGKGHWQGEIYNRHKNGSIYPEWLSISAILDDQGRTTGYIAAFSDISDKKEKEARLFHLAHYDPLTGLPNRRLLSDRMEQAILRAQRQGALLAVMLIDLDGFKRVNDTLGHEAGDQLLIEVARRIRAALRDADTVARQGGDEFVVLLENLSEVNAASAVAEKLVASLGRANELPGFAGESVFVGASIGIACYPRDGLDAATLLSSADAAMYVAKQAGGQTWRYGSQDLVSEATERLRLENELRHALSAGELRLFYQPKMELDSGRIYALEALIRWQHPQRGLISPVLFLPVAQDSHLMIDIGEWALDEALRQCRAWQDAGQPKILLDVNVDGAQLARGDFIEVVERAFARVGAKPCWLGLEITETAIMTHGQGVLTSLQELHRLGIELSIDDFGTGHSSLTRLKSMPKCTLKIDTSFVRDMVEDADDRAIIASIVALAHQLGLKTVAEGVENEQQLRLLREMGCDAIQGYFLARPMPADEVPDFLREQAAKGWTPT